MTKILPPAAPRSDSDNDWLALRASSLPNFSLGHGSVRIADLFCGSGGLSVGVAMAAHEAGFATDVVLAVDTDADAVATYSSLFPEAQVVLGSVVDIFGEVPARSATAMPPVLDVGKVDILLGGPPCQGHSDLNNRTRRDDPRNTLYLAMAYAARDLQPSAVLIENVPTVLHDRNGIVEETRRMLQGMGYDTADRVLSLVDLGVPQTRRRHVLLATKVPGLKPSVVLDDLPKQREPRTIRWAIEDLLDAAPADQFDAPSRPSRTNARRIRWLDLSGEVDLPNRLRPRCHRTPHSYKSMYGRLQWDSPAQTVTSGFGSMGQGRYVHPSQLRTLTPHEAARLQGLPDFMPLRAVGSRSGLARLIGNAVPPPLGREIAARLLPFLASIEVAA